MADIFLSYARDDREKAESLARTLQEAGWSVWWDRSILPGSSYEQVIEHELSSASSVVVLWSAAASQSNWVRDEATLAQSRNVLVSVLIDAATGLSAAADRQPRRLDRRELRSGISASRRRDCHARRRRSRRRGGKW